MAGSDSWVGAASCAGADCGACAGGVSELDEVVDECSGWRWLCLWREPALDVVLMVLPGNAWAAAPQNTPVRATEPAISQRFMRDARRSPASLAWVEER